jgi:ketosteroid isomerase-like protein
MDILAPAEIRERNVRMAREFFDRLHRKDVEGWSELWHEEARIIVFYPPEGFPSEITPKAEIVKGFRTLLNGFESFDPEITAIYPAADSEAIVVEYRPRATLVGGAVYTNANIAVFVFEDGLIREYHDYFDPRRFQLVVDALPKD